MCYNMKFKVPYFEWKLRFRRRRVLMNGKFEELQRLLCEFQADGRSKVGIEYNDWIDHAEQGMHKGEFAQTCARIDGILKGKNATSKEFQDTVWYRVTHAAQEMWDLFPRDFSSDGKEHVFDGGYFIVTLKDGMYNVLPNHKRLYNYKEWVLEDVPIEEALKLAVALDQLDSEDHYPMVAIVTKSLSALFPIQKLLSGERKPRIGLYANNDNECDNLVRQLAKRGYISKADREILVTKRTFVRPLGHEYDMVCVGNPPTTFS